MAERTDQHLLVAAGRGDRQAFGVLVERHHRAVVQFIYRYLANVDRDTAEDLAQDVFFGAWKAAPSFRARARVFSWLLRIAKNTCLNYRRGQKLRRTASLDRDDLVATTSASGDETAATEAVAREEAGSLRRAIAGLPPTQRAAIILRHYHDLPYSDIAEVLKTSVSAVESLLFRARTTLRKAMNGTRKTGERPQVLRDLRAESLTEGTVTRWDAAKHRE